MKIIEYEPIFEKDVKNLLVELQQYLSSLDKRGVVVLKDNYRDGYFDYVVSECREHSGKIFLAIRGLHVVGMVVCKIFQGGGEYELTTSCPKIGFISDLVVTEQSRGQGIGKKLLRRAEEYFCEQKCQYTQLEVFEPNKKAFDLYKKLGFTINCLYMSKKTEE